MFTRAELDIIRQSLSLYQPYGGQELTFQGDIERAEQLLKTRDKLLERVENLLEDYYDMQKEAVMMGRGQY